MQVLLSLCCTTATEVTLADVQTITASLQEAFGTGTPLETIIQQLVSQDLREQIAQRR